LRVFARRGVVGCVRQRCHEGRGREGRRPRYKLRLRCSPGLGLPSGDERAAVGALVTEHLGRASGEGRDAASHRRQLGKQQRLPRASWGPGANPPADSRRQESNRADARRAEVSVEALRGYDMGWSLIKSSSPFASVPPGPRRPHDCGQVSCRARKVLRGSGRSAIAQESSASAVRRVELQTAQPWARARWESRPAPSNAVGDVEDRPYKRRRIRMVPARRLHRCDSSCRRSRRLLHGASADRSWRSPEYCRDRRSCPTRERSDWW
jgi:hypothetical protein